jgi:16S rRNA (uracil1498-N3)-methyltransferase
MARRRFFVSSIRNRQAEIDGDEAHHLTRVLRVEQGDRFEISDGANIYLGEVVEARKSRVVFQILEPIPPRPLPARITLYAALIKFDHFEWTLEKGTEAGVERFIPLISERTEKGLDRAVEKRRDRWERILLEASQQCRRDRIPELAEVTSLRQALDNRADYRLTLEEAEGAPPILDALPDPDRRKPTDEVAILVGPEGGWTETERTMLRAEWTRVSLGPSILRAETAAIVGAAIVSAAWQSKR